MGPAFWRHCFNSSREADVSLREDNEFEQDLPPLKANSSDPPWRLVWGDAFCRSVQVYQSKAGTSLLQRRCCTWRDSLITFTLVHSHFQDASDFYGSQTSEWMAGVVGHLPAFKSLVATIFWGVWQCLFVTVVIKKFSSVGFHPPGLPDLTGPHATDKRAVVGGPPARLWFCTWRWAWPERIGSKSAFNTRAP